MVAWGSDWNLNGLVRKNLHSSVKTGPLADAAIQLDSAGLLGTVGTVDAEIITRLQYDVPHHNDYFTTYLSMENDVQFTGSMSFDSLDFAAHPGRNMTMSLFLLPASIFGDDAVPSPDQIMAVAHFALDSAGNPIGSIPDPGDVPTFRAGDGISSPASSVGFSITIPISALSPNVKYWALVAPTAVVPGSDPSVPNDIVLQPVASNARAISFWTNRTPQAPVITSPVSGTAVTAGRDVTFSFQPNDPDALADAPGDFRSWSFADLAGVQVQYAPQVPHGAPEPTWIDLPIATTHPALPPTAGRGWFIENADGTLAYDGAKQLRDTRTMQIRCGGASILPGKGILPSGNWQLRMRTFDYGHPLSTVQKAGSAGVGADGVPTAVPGYGPLGTWGPDSPPRVLDSGGIPIYPWPDTDYTPDTFPVVNTSPWSKPINLSVSTQVPAPLPVSPINHNAIAAGTPVTLRWQYRNTHRPSFAQQCRQVQIRKKGETAWTTVVSGNSPDHFYSVTSLTPDNLPDAVPGPDTREYLTNGGFEGSGLDGWETNAPGHISIIAGTVGDTDLRQGPRSGSQALVMDTAPSSSVVEHPFRNMVALQVGDRYLSIKGWAYKGPNTTDQRLLVWFMTDTPEILATTGFIPIPNLGDAWSYVEVLNLERPPGVSHIWVMVLGTAPSNTNVYDAIDDFSILGSPTLPVEVEPLPTLVFPTQSPTAYTLEATTEYEWRVRVADEGNVVSDWSTPGQFWIVDAPGSGPGITVPGETIEGATLGVGRNRAYIYRRGGKVRIGELGEVSYLDWGRLRDDISTSKIIVSGWDLDTGCMLSQLQTWAYEVVIFRDNGYSVDRVWEGPITLLTYEWGKVTIHAKDVMAFAYRRIIKQDMIDTAALGGDTVVGRAARVLQNVLAPDDPNLLQYLTIIANDDDAMEYRTLPAYSRTAYEEVDDMAANAGLDYASVGRSIILWGTKRRIGTLPEFRDENFGASPIVSEYGMSMANVYSVSDGSGAHGEAYRLLLPESEQTSDEIYGEDGTDDTYGLVEMLSSSWASGADDQSGTYTDQGLATVEAAYSEYAERSISDRYPPPVVVRVPDNTTLNPNTPVSIQQLLPGMVAPLRSTKTLRTVMSNQKLDSMKVVQTKDGETISVTFSLFNHDDLATVEGDDS